MKIIFLHSFVLWFETRFNCCTSNGRQTIISLDQLERKFSFFIYFVSVWIWKSLEDFASDEWISWTSCWSNLSRSCFMCRITVDRCFSKQSPHNFLWQWSLQITSASKLQRSHNVWVEILMFESIEMKTDWLLTEINPSLGIVQRECRWSKIENVCHKMKMNFISELFSLLKVRKLRTEISILSIRHDATVSMGFSHL